MEQKGCYYYCEELKTNIGKGFCCFNCSHFKRSRTLDKKCEHERVTGEYIEEI